MVFTDEKRFNLYGPDDFQYYLHDLRKHELCLSRHHNREGVDSCQHVLWNNCSILIDQKKDVGRCNTLLMSVFLKLNAVCRPLSWISSKLMLLFKTQET